MCVCVGNEEETRQLVLRGANEHYQLNTINGTNEQFMEANKHLHVHLSPHMSKT